MALLAALAACLLCPGRTALAQKEPHIGYLYPAGGRQGTTVKVTVGGQNLEGASSLLVLGGGMTCTLGQHLKILTPQQLNGVKNNLDRMLMLEEIAKTNAAVKRDAEKVRKQVESALLACGIKELSRKAISAYSKSVSDPKRQLNPALSETLTLTVMIAADAAPGDHEVRILSTNGLSNPMPFRIGTLPEVVEREPNNKKPDVGVTSALPFVVNGQILPGDIDRFRFAAKKGDRLVAAASARELIPYLADAVPGWFQATLALYDAKDREIVYQDDFRFNPDPVLFCEIPADGDYTVEIKDSIFRGREDFVYRIALGQFPFATGIQPMGGKPGTDTEVQVTGWNLPIQRVKLATASLVPGVHAVAIGKDQAPAPWNHLPFDVQSLESIPEQEPNDTMARAASAPLPIAVEGRISAPGDRDIYSFQGRAGDEVVAEVMARRLGSPLDSVLMLTDGDGVQLAMNDDHEDKGSGLMTHHADARLQCKLPKDGRYFVHLGDSQQAGSEAHRYRLRIGPPRPDFALRVTPSCLNLRPGETLAFTVFALRQDGFDGDITLALKDAPAGFQLGGAWVPSGQGKARVTLTAPFSPVNKPIRLALEGRASIGGNELVRKATPAEDMMQAFFYRHLVPSSDEWMAFVTDRGRGRTVTKLIGTDPVRIQAGKTTHVRYAATPTMPAKEMTLTLSDPPEGISIDKFTAGKDSLDVQLSADPAKIKAGLKGNLIVEVFTERTPKAQEGKPKPEKQRVALGALPAVPFEVLKPVP